MKIYFSHKRGNYTKNTKSGSATFIDKFYKFMDEEGIEVTNDFNDSFDIHFALFCDGNAIISKNRGKKVVTRVDGLYSPACGGDWKKINDLISETVKVSDHTIFLNKYCLDTFNHFSGFTPENYSFIPNGCDNDIFKPPITKKFNNNILFYGEVRRFIQIKTVVKSIDLVREKIPDAELWIVGDIKPEFRMGIPDKPYIKLIGAIKNCDLPKYADQCSVMGMCSSKAADHSTVSECLCCGLPVVCYDDGGCHYKIGDAGIILESEYYGWDRFAENNPENYANALVKVLKDKHAYYIKALKTRESLSLSLMKQKYLEVLKNVL